MLRHARLSDFEIELQQVAVDTWSAPQRIVDARPSDQGMQIRIDSWPITCRWGLPMPAMSKTVTVPPHQGIGSDDPKGIHVGGNQR